MGGSEMVWSGSGWRQLEGLFEHGNEHLLPEFGEGEFLTTGESKHS